MAESDGIDINGIIVDQSDRIAQLERMDELLVKIQADLRGEAAASGGTTRAQTYKKDSDGLKGLNEQLQKQRDIQNGLNATQKLAIDNQIALNAAKTKYRQEAKAVVAEQTSEEGSVLRMNAAYNALIQKYDRVNATTRSQMLPAIQQLKTELEAAKQATGRFTGAVGDYHDNTIKYAKGLRGLGGIGRLAARIFGFDPESFQMIQEAGRALKEYHHTQEGLKAATEANTIAQQANQTAIKAKTVIVQEEALAEAGDSTAVEYNTAVTEANIAVKEEEAGVSNVALGLWGLLAVAVIAGAVALYEWTKGIKDDTEEWAKNNEMLKKGIDIRRKLRQEIQKLGTSQGKATGLLSEGDKKELDEFQELAQKKFEIATKAKEELEKLNYGLYEAKKSNGLSKEDEEYFKSSVALFDELEKAKKDNDVDEINRLELILSHKKALIQKEADDEIKLEEKASEARIIIAATEEAKKNKAKNTSLSIEGMTPGREKDLAANENERVKAIEESDKTAKQMGLINQVYREKQIEINDKYDKEELKAYDVVFEELKKKYDLDTAAYFKAQKEKYDKEKKLRDERDKFNQKVIDQTEGDKPKEQHLEDLRKSELAENEIVNKGLEIRKEYERMINAHYDKLIADDHREEYKKMVDADLQAASELAKEKSDLQLAALKTDAEMLSSEAQVQATLAAAGKKNSLDASLAAESKNAEAQKQIQRKAAQEQQALALSKAFIDSYDGFIKKGDSPSKAIGEALTSVALAKGIATGLMAAFFDGTADTGAGGGLDGKGGFAAILHPREAVINRKRNQEMPGMSEAWLNGDYVAMASMLLPQFAPSSNSMSNSGITEEMLVSALRKVQEEAPLTYTYTEGNDTVLRTVRGISIEKIIIPNTHPDPTINIYQRR